RWTKPLTHFAGVLLADQPHHPRTHLLGLGAIRTSPGVAMHQGRCAVFSVPFPQTLGLPVAQLHSLRRLDYRPGPILNLCQHSRTRHLPHAHRASPQSHLRLWGGVLKGSFLMNAYEDIIKNALIVE